MVVFSPDGRTMAAGYQFSVVKLFDSADGRELSTLQRFEFAIDWAHALAFSPDSRNLATGNQDPNELKKTTSTVGQRTYALSKNLTQDLKSPWQSPLRLTTYSNCWRAMHPPAVRVRPNCTWCASPT